ncbi:MAG: NADH:flavin oxidoreductase [Bacillota bacterium]|nr:NADH:flavin oxidoreductase [Bacillota bacterium]
MALLFTEFRVKGLRLKNRVAMPPMANNLATEAGEVTPPLVEHYATRAESLGLIIVEHAYVVREGRIHPNQLGVHDDRLVAGLRRITEAVHAAGGRGALQITHGGAAAPAAVIGQVPVAPSPVPHPLGGDQPRELRRDEIPGLVEAFARAARRVQEAGFDAVEVHGAHGYLLNQFFSPLTNRRTDEYGGNRERRLGFPLAVVRAVRQAVGPEYPVFYRLGADDRLPGGLTVDDAVWAAPLLAEAGVDLLDLSGGICGSRPEGLNGQGYFSYLSAAVKQVSPVPVLVTGGITEPRAAEDLLRQGKTDLVGVGRALLKDPDWAVKAKAALA